MWGLIFEGRRIPHPPAFVYNVLISARILRKVHSLMWQLPGCRATESAIDMAARAVGELAL
jgi:hypothetical protein